MRSGDGCSSTCQVEAGYTCPTPGSPCTTVCGNGIVSGAEVCDDFNNSACGTCSAACSVAKTITAATGTITAVSSAIFLSGETFTLSDGIHPAVVFELTTGVPAAGHVAVPIGGSATAAQMAARIVEAINGTGVVAAAVNAGSSTVVNLTNRLPGAAGNVPIQSTVTANNFKVTGMSGGSAYDCATGVGCASAADCASRVCTSNLCAAPACNDGVLNGLETDVDCGGGTCSRCGTSLACVTDADCTSGACAGGLCQ
jgi:cysteine-rich repeat protein